MRNISCTSITEAVEKLCIESNINASPDIVNALKKSMELEKSPRGREILECLYKNTVIAKEKCIPICQDTGMAVVFIELGQDVHVTGGYIEDAVNEGIRNGYIKGQLRKSVVKDPVLRGNSGDNTPAIIHYSIVPGDKVKITVAPKGFGSENMSAVKMLPPSAGREGIIDFVVDTVNKAGPNPCPPVIVGVGIGGTFEKVAFLAKKALLRNINTQSPVPHIAEMEKELYEKINALGIGPGGLGGSITALKVAIEVFPTHIAGLPVAVNMGCHATRHGEVVLG